MRPLQLAAAAAISGALLALALSPAQTLTAPQKQIRMNRDGGVKQLLPLSRYTLRGAGLQRNLCEKRSFRMQQRTQSRFERHSCHTVNVCSTSTLACRFNAYCDFTGSINWQSREVNL
jgi:hypothetical protein